MDKDDIFTYFFKLMLVIFIYPNLGLICDVELKIQ